MIALLMNFDAQIQTILTSSNFVVYIFTEEEDRLEYILKYTVKKLFKQKVLVWNFIDGYTGSPNQIVDCKQNPLDALNNINNYKNTKIKIFLLKDFHHFLTDISINRKLKNLSNYLKNNYQYLILCGTNNNIPLELKEYITFLSMPLPNKQEILREIRYIFEQAKINNCYYQEMIAKAYKGFSIQQIRNSISKLIQKDLSNKEIITKILEEKKKTIQYTGGLEFHLPTSFNLEIGGLNNLKHWLKIREFSFTKEAYTYGIKMPKGLLLVGIQGTGKSLSAQVIARQWNVPLFKLDISQVFAGILGESENRITRIINTCSENSPCVLWIDEIDKIFNEESNNNDSGTKQRVTNIFLTWLSEKHEEVFILATANTISKLPIELLRKGRFDEIFFVDLPNFQERLQIFAIHLKKIRPITWNKYNIYYLSQMSLGFSGAEIEQSIIEGMYVAFYEKREFTTKDIQTAIQRIIPLSKTEKSKILSLRKWGYSGKVNIA